MKKSLKLKPVPLPPWRRTLNKLWKYQGFRTFAYSFGVVMAVMTPWYLMGEDTISVTQLTEYKPPAQGVDPLRYLEEREGGLRVYQRGNTLLWANDPASKRPPIPPKAHP